MLLSDPVHFSTLKHMAKSPKHYRASVLQPTEPTAAMRLGSAIHAVHLGAPYVIWHAERRANAWKEFRDAHAAKTARVEDGGQVVEMILSEAEYQRALWCSQALHDHPEARRLLEGQREVVREGFLLGRHIAGRVDVIGDGFVSELKSCSDAHPVRFQYGARRLGYHAQLAWYRDMIGCPDWPAFVVTVETKPPWDVVVHELTQAQLAEGRKCYRLWMEQLLQCEASDAWPGYSQAVVPWDAAELDEPLLIDGEEVAA